MRLTAAPLERCSHTVAEGQEHSVSQLADHVTCCVEHLGGWAAPDLGRDDPAVVGHRPDAAVVTQRGRLGHQVPEGDVLACWESDRGAGRPGLSTIGREPLGQEWLFRVGRWTGFALHPCSVVTSKAQRLDRQSRSLAPPSHGYRCPVGSHVEIEQIPAMPPAERWRVIDRSPHKGFDSRHGRFAPPRQHPFGIDVPHGLGRYVGARDALGAFQRPRTLRRATQASLAQPDPGRQDRSGTTAMKAPPDGLGRTWKNRRVL